MVTRAQAGIFNAKHPADLASLSSTVFFHALLSTKEPRGYKSAAKKKEWLDAMDSEMEALHTNNTWDLVPRPPIANVVGSKWVFRTKLRSNGTIDCHKARLVAQGFTQLPGFDFTDTFSPVIKASTVRIVLSLVVSRNWVMHQLDVKNAFLHGLLNETVYMEQPRGYLDPRFPDHVCKLNKALYGLKQAPGAWFQRFSNFLLALGLTCSKVDTSLFMFFQDANILYLLVYVDDMIPTGNNASLIRRLITRINAKFAVKDLGRLNYFLGLEVIHTDDGIFLGQAKYAREILSRALMLEAKLVSTPMVTGQSLIILLLVLYSI